MWWNHTERDLQDIYVLVRLGMSWASLPALNMTNIVVKS